MDGLEATVDPWCEGLTPALVAALAQLQQQGQAQDSSAKASPAASQPASGQPGGAELLAAVTAAPAVAAAGAAAAPSIGLELSGASAAGSTPPSAQASLLAEGESQGGLSTACCCVRCWQLLARLQQLTRLLALLCSACFAAADSSSSQPAAAPAPAAAAEPAQLVEGLLPPGVQLVGVPPLAPCRVRLTADADPQATAAAAAREAALPTAQQQEHRDAAGLYSAAQPFWARISGAR